MIRIGITLGSTRPNRDCSQVAQWVLDSVLPSVNTPEERHRPPVRTVGRQGGRFRLLWRERGCARWSSCGWFAAPWVWLM